MRLAIALISMIFSTTLQAESPTDLPEEKLRELQRAGIETWPPSEPPTGPSFSKLEPGRPAGDGAEFYPTDLVYDNGVLNALPTSFGRIYGNRFDLRSDGLPLGTSFFLQTFSFYFLEASPSDTDLYFQFSDPLNATSITSRSSVNFTGLTNSGASFSSPVLNVITSGAFSGLLFDQTMYVGAWCLNANTTFPVDNETVGLNNTATFIGGFQGFSAASGIDAVTFNSRAFNALLRATVKEVPVELMSFAVD